MCSNYACNNIVHLLASEASLLVVQCAQIFCYIYIHIYGYITENLSFHEDIPLNVGLENCSRYEVTNFLL